MRVLIDTNVLLRSTEPGHSHYQCSVDSIDQLRRLGHDLIIVPQVLYEFWSVATRPIANNGLGLSSIDAHREVTAVKSLFRLLKDERGIYSVWDQLVVAYAVKGKQAHDARLAAAIQRHGVSHLLTFNTGDFVRFPFMTAISPVDVASGAVSI